MFRPKALMVAFCFLLISQPLLIAAPETINIQGTLTDSTGQPILGSRAYSVQFYDSESEGSPLGTPIEGFITPSGSGRFSIELVPPMEILSASEVYYQLGIDSADPSDGTVDPGDLFPDRARVNSVPFARSSAQADISQTASHATTAEMAEMANHALTADTAESATMANHATTADSADTAVSADSAVTAMGLSGSLSSPGDQIPLGDGVVLQVASDGTVELLAGGERLRLARQKWFDPKNTFENISPDGQSAIAPSVAIDEDGNAIIVWIQDNGSLIRVFRSEYRKGAWKDPSTLLDDIVSSGLEVKSAASPAMSDNGEAIIVWSQTFSGGDIHIVRTEFRMGLWTEDEIFSPAGEGGTRPKVVMGGSGESLIVWRQSDGANLQVFRSEYREGAWDDPSGVTDNISPGSTDVSDPAVAMNDDGESLIVWRQFDGSTFQIFRSEYRDGSWSDPTSLTDNISPDGEDAVFSSAPDVAIDNAGNAIVVWVQFDGTTDQVFRSEYRDGAWTDPADLSDSISNSGGVVRNPKVAMGGNGDAIIVWEQLGGVYRTEYRKGMWTDPHQVAPSGGNACFPNVDMNDHGDAIIVWDQEKGFYPQIYRSEYRNGSWTDPASLSDNISPDGSTAIFPEVTLNNNGEAIIVWRQVVGPNNQIFRSEYRFGF